LRLFGHEVRSMPPAYAKPYVKRQKNIARLVDQGSSNAWN
jgi:hypothetical protein